MKTSILCLVLSLACSTVLAQDKLFAEKVILRLNQSIFLEQDEVSVSGFIFSYDGYRLSDMSEVVHLNIIDNSGEMLFNKRIKASQCVFSESFTLPPQVGVGRFTVVAYTNWMLNFPSVLPAKLPIRVYSIDGAIVDNKPDDDLRKIRAFSPSSNLLAGHFNVVVFEAPVEKINNGIILRNGEDTVGNVTRINDNLAYAKIFCQSINDTFLALINDQVIKLPQVSSTASVIDVLGLKNDTLSILVKNGSKQAGAAELTISINQVPKITSPINLSERQLQLKIPTKALSKGLISILLSQDEKDLASALYYEVPEYVNSDLKIQQNSPQTRKIRIAGKVGLGNAYAYLDMKKSGNVASAESVPLVHQLFLLSNLHQQSIYSKPESIFEKHIGLKSFLIKGNAKLKENAAAALASTDFKMEKDEFFVKGRLTKNDSPEENIKLICTVNGKSNAIYIADTDENGGFNFMIPDFYDQAQLIIRPDVKDPSEYEINIFETDFSAEKFQSVNYLTLSEEELAILRKEKDKEDLVNRAYYPSTNSELELNPTGDYLSDYTLELNYSEYILLNDFEEIRKELLPGMETVKGTQGEEIRLRGYNKIRQMYTDTFDDPPLFLIDGIPERNLKNIFSLEPSRISYIRMINSEVFISGEYFDGLVDITTKEASFYNKWKDKVFSYSLAGYSKIPELNEPNQKDRLPAINPLVYSGIINLDEDGRIIEVVRPDIKGRFDLVMDGTDGQGRFFKTSTTFELKGK